TRSKRDWSSDVCSSDLVRRIATADVLRASACRRPDEQLKEAQHAAGMRMGGARWNRFRAAISARNARGESSPASSRAGAYRHRADRKSVVEGKRVRLGG